MRFVLAIVLFVVAFVAIGLGVAQRTIFLGPDHVTSEVSVAGGAPFTVIDGEALNAYPGNQTVSISGPGAVFMAYGRADDIEAWIGDASSASVDFDAEAAELVSSAQPGSEVESPSPAGSDLWIQEFSGEGSLVRKVNVPSDVAMIVASDGVQPAPSQISITWPLDNSTPWSSPLVVGGVGALLLGLIVLMWALLHARRRRGPRRKTPKMPKPPRPAQLKPAPRRTAITVGAPEPASHGRRRAFVAIPLVLTGALVLSACTADGATPDADPSSTDQTTVAEIDPPVVTKRQFQRIIAQTADAITAADEERDADAAATRLSGPALQLRTTNYKVRGVDKKIAAIPEFPSDVRVILPQQRRDWPRVVFAAVGDVDGSDDAEYGLTFVQESPRDPYKVHYLVRLTQSIPEVAPVDLGAASLAPDNKLLAAAPAQLATEYGDILLKGDGSAFAANFDAENDLLREHFGADYKQKRRKSMRNASIKFASAVGAEEPYALATNDTGAIVSVELRETETVKPSEAGAAINPKGAVKALSRKITTTKGIAAEYGMQVLFYVPPVTAEDQRVRILGFTQGLVGAREVR